MLRLFVVSDPHECMVDPTLFRSECKILSTLCRCYYLNPELYLLCRYHWFTCMKLRVYVSVAISISKSSSMRCSLE
eukprot:1315276-Amphidinium_carterae.3